MVDRYFDCDFFVFGQYLLCDFLWAEDIGNKLDCVLILKEHTEKLKLTINNSANFTLLHAKHAAYYIHLVFEALEANANKFAALIQIVPSDAVLNHL